MSFTKAPVTDTHNTVRVESLGSSFLVSTDNVTYPVTLNYIDCFPLKEKQHGHDPKYRVSKREPYKTLYSVAANSSTTYSNSVIVSSAADSVFFAKGDTFYRLQYNSGSPLLSSITTNTEASVSVGTNAVDEFGERRVVYLTNSGAVYHWNEAGSDIQQNTPSQALQPSGGLEFINGYLFAVGADNYIYNSDPGNKLLIWNTTNFLSAEIYPDPVNFIAKHKNYLVTFGTQSIEFFYDAAIEVGSPLARQETYASRVGSISLGIPGKNFCKIDDDIYFIGKTVNSYASLYRIRDFKVEDVGSQYLVGVLNQAVSLTSQLGIQGVETILVNNNPMVMINITGQTANPVYYPETDSWILLSTSDLKPFTSRIGSMWVSDRWGQFAAGKRPFYITMAEGNPSSVEIMSPDQENTISNSATYYSEVVDLGINYWKHIARVDAIGDYGNTSLTLSYSPNGNYTGYVQCSPVQTPASIGFFNNISWYNLGRYRRFTFKITMAGAGPALHDAFDITYNVGAA